MKKILIPLLLSILLAGCFHQNVTTIDPTSALGQTEVLSPIFASP